MNRIDCFDLETTDLKATFGHILAGCFLPLHDDKVVVFRLDDRKYKPKKRLHDDSKLVEAIRDYMEESFAWVGWNSKMFDVPFVQTRLALQRKRLLNKRMHVDLMYYARRPNLVLHNSRLDTMAKSFRMADQKTVLDPEIWNAAFELDRDAMDYVVEHCIQDTKVLQESWDILSPFIKNMHF